MPATPTTNELAELRNSWGWILAMGICMVVAGVVAISLPLLATVGVVTFLGLILLAAGVAQIISAFHCKGWEGVLLNTLMGILYAVTGFLILENPIKGAAGLTLILALFFLVSGIFRIVIALQGRFPGWGWALLSGAVTVLLGLIIWRQFPQSTMWLVGMLVGIEFLFNGWMWMMVAFAFRQIPAEDGDSSSE